MLLCGCIGQGQSNGSIRIKARPGKVTGALEPGSHPLGIRSERDPILYIPKLADPEKSAPLLVYLHGATGSEQQGIRRLGSFADKFGFVLLSPASAGMTWDAIRGEYGPDVHVIDEALKKTFAAANIDSRKIGLAGFSDGASYALGLGLSNGDLFKSILAFSPGFIPEGWQRNGSPSFFFSHGTADQILPIDSASRRIVPSLKAAGFDVTYQEFDGPHGVTPEVLEQAIAWFLK